MEHPLVGAGRRNRVVGLDTAVGNLLGCRWCLGIGRVQLRRESSRVSDCPAHEVVGERPTQDSRADRAGPGGAVLSRHGQRSG